MKKTSALIFVSGLVAALHVASAANISGTITLKGTPPAEIEIPQLSSDPICSKLHAGPAKTRFYTVGPKGELADVFVTLKGQEGKSTGATAGVCAEGNVGRIGSLTTAIFAGFDSGN